MASTKERRSAGIPGATTTVSEALGVGSTAPGVAIGEPVEDMVGSAGTPKLPEWPAMLEPDVMVEKLPSPSDRSESLVGSVPSSPDAISVHGDTVGYGVAVWID